MTVETVVVLTLLTDFVELTVEQTEVVVVLAAKDVATSAAQAANMERSRIVDQSNCLIEPIVFHRVMRPS